MGRELKLGLMEQGMKETINMGRRRGLVYLSGQTGLCTEDNL